MPTISGSFETQTPQQLSELICSGDIINPHPCQMEAITYFDLLIKGDPLVAHDNNPFAPRFSLFLEGEPGSGKTHIMAAAALVLHKMLWEVLDNYMKDATTIINREVGKMAAQDEHGMKVIEDDDKKKSREKEHLAKVAATLKEKLGRQKFHPTDLLYIGFDDLYELIRRSPESRDSLIDQIIKARLLFLDDPHPKGDEERLQVFGTILERRYDSGMMGTFVTSNLTLDNFVFKEMQNAADLTKRMKSRWEESGPVIKFEGVPDMRKALRSALWKPLWAQVKGQAHQSSKDANEPDNSTA